MRFIQHTAIKPEAGKFVPAQNDVWIRFIVPEQNVVTRLQAFDQIVFQQQRLGFGARYRGFDVGYLRHHQLRSGRQIAFLKIRRDALLETNRLADIDHLAFGVDHAINARLQRQIPANFLGVKTDLRQTS